MKLTTMHTECSVCSIHFPRRRLVPHPRSTLQTASPPRAPQTTGAMVPLQVNSPEKAAPRSSSEVNATRIVAVSVDRRPLYERHMSNPCRSVHQFCGRRYRTILSGDKLFSANRCYTAYTEERISTSWNASFFRLPSAILSSASKPPLVSLHSPPSPSNPSKR